MSKSFTRRNQQWLSPELVSLIVYATKAIAKAKGYLTYPKEGEVKLVLQGLYIVNMAIKAREKQNGARRSRETKNLKQSVEQTNSEGYNGYQGSQR